jgi:hypothetical protein
LHSDMNCAFRFEHRPHEELIEIISGPDIVRVCENCLTLLVVHRRIHHMRIEQLLHYMGS